MIKHGNICIICQDKFATKGKLDKHIQDAHRYSCTECDKTEESQENLNKHVQEKHSEETIVEDAYKCEYCDFEETSVQVMKEHIIEKHTRKDNNNQFVCDDCDFTCDKRGKLITHFRNNHVEKNPAEKEGEDGLEETTLKEEHRQLRNNFERLNTLFQESLEEVDRVKSEYTAKLLDTNERFRVTLKENEELKEKVEILFKLGRSYIDKVEVQPVSEERVDKGQDIPSTKDGRTEEPEAELIEDDLESLSTWTTNKFRGFRRVSPTTKAQKSKESASETRAPPSQRPSTGPSDPPPGPAKTPSTSVNERLQNLARSDSPQAVTNQQYCYYFTNYGNCYFEEKTGQKCRFEHKVAPMCQNGTACSRLKCMYTHPNMGGRNEDFLGRNSGFQNAAPWPQMMNQYMNPWNILNMNPFQQQTMNPFQQQGMGRAMQN